MKLVLNCSLVIDSLVKCLVIKSSFCFLHRDILHLCCLNLWMNCSHVMELKCLLVFKLVVFHVDVSKCFIIMYWNMGS